MGFKVIITGSSGMVGKGVLYECLDSPKVKTVLVVNRAPIKLNHPKLKEILIVDFFNLNGIKKDLGGFDACFFCIGTSAFRKSEEVYSRITYDLTLNFAQAFLEQNRDSVFCYVSGAGTDATEKSRMMWARVKGKTENALLKLPFKATYMFRPGFIQPLRGIWSKTKGYNAFYFLFRPLYVILKHFPRMVTSTVNTGKAMINAVDKEITISILHNQEINLLAKEYKLPPTINIA